MILPGISGSFVLVLFGMYGPVLEAIKAFDLVFILVFALGCGSGLLRFSRVLHWLLHHYHQATMALLTGFLFGSLPVVWPWKRVAQRVEDSHGDLQPVQQFPVLPSDFHIYSGQDPQLWFCILLAIMGFILVWQIHARWGHDEAA